MQQFDLIHRVRERVNEMTRAGDKITLEVASWFIPAGQLTKLRYLKYAATLFKFKRGIHVVSGLADLTTQVIVKKGDITQINPVSTLASTLIGNPFLSTIPGAFVNLSYDKIQRQEIFSNPADANVYKNIVFSTLGNYLGGKLGNGFESGSTLPGGGFMGEVLGTTGIGILDEMTPMGKKE